MELNLIYKDNHKVLNEKECSGVPLLTCPDFETFEHVSAGFTTRFGGVSVGECATMNLIVRRDDTPEAVFENRRRIAKAIGVEEGQLVFTNQIHSTNVSRVFESDAGKTFIETDGLVTNAKGICLVIFGADCVPVLYYDPVKQAVGASHCGWKGTVNQMVNTVIEKMKVEFGSNPEDIHICIGPSICQNCYEVSEDVIDQFRAVFDESQWDALVYQKENGKYQLDLWKANELVARKAGVKKEKITIGNVCTYCNPHALFSHRRTGVKRGLISGCISII